MESKEHLVGGFDSYSNIALLVQTYTGLLIDELSTGPIDQTFPINSNILEIVDPKINSILNKQANLLISHIMSYLAMSAGYFLYSKLEVPNEIMDYLKSIEVSGNLELELKDFFKIEDNNTFVFRMFYGGQIIKEVVFTRDLQWSHTSTFYYSDSNIYEYKNEANKTQILNIFPNQSPILKDNYSKTISDTVTLMYSPVTDMASTSIKRHYQIMEEAETMQDITEEIINISTPASRHIKVYDYISCAKLNEINVTLNPDTLEYVVNSISDFVNFDDEKQVLKKSRIKTFRVLMNGLFSETIPELLDNQIHGHINYRSVMTSNLETQRIMSIFLNSQETFGQDLEIIFNEFGSPVRVKFGKISPYVMRANAYNAGIVLLLFKGEDSSISYQLLDDFPQYVNIRGLHPQMFYKYPKLASSRIS